jgi:hypothetical protein
VVKNSMLNYSLISTYNELKKPFLAKEDVDLRNSHLQLGRN